MARQGRRQALTVEWRPQVFRTLKAGPYTRALAYETEGVYIASVSAAGHLQVWDIATGKPECSLKKAAPKVPHGLIGHPEGRPNVVCSVFEITQVHVPRQYVPNSDQVDVGSASRCGLAWHPDGSLLAAAGASNDIVVYERLSWDPVMELQEGHDSPINCLQFSPNGEYLLPCMACSDCPCLN